MNILLKISVQANGGIIINPQITIGASGRNGETF
jgi:hypothetical protein